MHSKYVPLICPPNNRCHDRLLTDFEASELEPFAGKQHYEHHWWVAKISHSSITYRPSQPSQHVSNVRWLYEVSFLVNHGHMKWSLRPSNLGVV